MSGSNHTEVIEELYQKHILVTKEVLVYVKEGKSASEIEALLKKDEKPVISIDAYREIYSQRFDFLAQKIQEQYPEKQFSSINRLRVKQEREEITIIAMVLTKEKTRNEHIKLTVEDKTGITTVLVLQNSEKLLFTKAQNLLEDECMLLTGTKGNDAIFAKDIQTTKIEKKKQQTTDAQAIIHFCGDLCVGSKEFQEEQFKNYCIYLKEHKEITHLIFTGRIIQGITAEKPIEEQYAVFVEYIKDLPQQIYILSSSQEVGSAAVPIQKIENKLFQKQKNITLLPSPATVTIANKTFFVYDGESIGTYAHSVPILHSAQPEERTIKTLQFLVNRYHLSPTYGITQTLPNNDPLLLKTIPDAIVVGYMRHATTKTHNGIELMSCGTFCDDATHEKKVLVPQSVGKVVEYNVKEGKVIIRSY